MLTERSSRARDWLTFSLLALLPAAATALLGFRALHNEEAATRADLGLLCAAEAQRLRLAIKAELDNFMSALPPSTPSASEALKQLAGKIPAFATPLLIARGQVVGIPSEPETAAPAECEGIASRVMSAQGKEHDDLVSLVLGACQEVRSHTGRWLFPILAPSSPKVPAGELVNWIERHAHRMTAPERRALALDIARSAASPADQQRALSVLTASPPAELPALLREPEAVAAFARGPDSSGTIGWQSAAATARLEQRGDLWLGFIVHRPSLEAGLAAHWPELPSTLVARIIAGIPPSTGSVPAAELPVTSAIYLSIEPRDQEVVAKQTRQSQLVLAIGVGLTVMLAFGVAGTLFARERATRRTSALRMDLVSTVSHELRTPIASVQLFAELLEGGLVPPQETAEVYAALTREATRLSSTVGRMLSFGRLEAGRHAAHRDSMQLSETVAAAVDVFEQRHPELPGVVRVFEPTAKLPHDAELVALAVENLLENAHKYAPKGTPYEVRVSGDAAEGRVTVADRGPGIARRHQTRIFAAFERVDDRLSRSTQGAGIGLALVQHVARAHGGKASVVSELGRGASFFFTLKAVPHA